MDKRTYFQKQLDRSQARVASKRSEAKYVHNQLHDVVRHLQEIKELNPWVTYEDMKKIILTEIAHNSTVVLESSTIFYEYMSYICAQYCISHPKKYAEISEAIKNSDVDFEKEYYQKCSSFDEYLSYFVYCYKQSIFDEYLSSYFESTPENYKNVDELLAENLETISSDFFGKNFSAPQVSQVFVSSMNDKAKLEKITAFSKCYKSPITRQAFVTRAKFFLNGSFGLLPGTVKLSETHLRKGLANSTEKIIQRLDYQGHLNDYMVSHVLQMCNIGFPEFATPFCNNGMPDEKFSSCFEFITPAMRKANINRILNPDKVRETLSSSYLLSNKNLAIEDLFALHAFWLNRYAKELNSYSEAMFALIDFDFISKILASKPGEDIKIDISLDDIDKILVKMGVLYLPTAKFIQEKQLEVNGESTGDNKTDDVDKKIRYFSYDPFIERLKKQFTTDGHDEYSEYFSEILPGAKNNLAEDAEFYAKLYNPIENSYMMKDDFINAIVASFDNVLSFEFPNAGIVLDSVTDKSSLVVLGVDAGFSAPVRMHVSRYDLCDFLKSINGNTMLPVYEGNEDFANLPSPLVFPLTEKHKSILKKANKDLLSYKNPNVVAHLGFIDEKHAPEHLKTSVFDSKGREKKVFQKRYIDLETGEVYIKFGDEYVKQEVKVSGKGEISDYEL